MSLLSLAGLAASLVLVMLLHTGVLRAVRAVVLAAYPLSGEHLDSFVYHRSTWTPGEKDLYPVWAGVALAGAAAWAAVVFDWSWAWAIAVLAWAGALGWDLWRWERAACSVKFVTWRRGWQQTARRAPVSHIKDVHVVEKALYGPLGNCYVAFQLEDGKAIKLPRTVLPGGLAAVEDFANFVRLQMQQVEDMRRRIENERRRAGKPPLDATEREIRARIKALRQAKAKQPTTP
ncbi:MAG TPA: hypothetical protein VNO84_00205 [Burkholderiaceae bacterium]|nr:hypothetical protein [Burkholderiaceae bacterium]